MRVVIQQDVAPPSLILADVIEIKLHSWKHLLHLLGEAKKKKKRVNSRRQIQIYSLKELSNKTVSKNYDFLPPEGTVSF